MIGSPRECYDENMKAKQQALMFLAAEFVRQLSNSGLKFKELREANDPRIASANQIGINFSSIPTFEQVNTAIKEILLLTGVPDECAVCYRLSLRNLDEASTATDPESKVSIRAIQAYDKLINLIIRVELCVGPE